MRDADRLWRFDRAGIALASSWFAMDPATYTDRLATEIVPELITQAAHDMAAADLNRSNALLQDGGDPMTSATHDAPALVARTELSLPHTHVDTIFVDGAWQPSRGTGRNPVTDPATGEVWGSVPDGTPGRPGRRRRLCPACLSGRVAPAYPV